jgi:hypothetical protein
VYREGIPDMLVSSMEQLMVSPAQPRGAQWEPQGRPA